MPEKRLIIIDSNSLIHRAFHALPSLKTRKGELVNAVYGFLLVFLKAARELQPDFVAACFDFPAPTFRHKKYKEYKITRPPTPKELSQQIPIVKKVLKAFNVPIFEKKGFEADDLIGTIAKLAPKKQISPGTEIIVLSGDLDTLQLINSYTEVYFLQRGVKDTVLYNRELVKKRYGLEPEQLVDFKALRGDPSDNIPGVPGVGEKTAIGLIKNFGSLESLYEFLEKGRVKEQMKEKIQNSEFKIRDSLRAKLLENKEQAFFSRSLAQIKRDVSLDFNLRKCKWRSYNRERVIQVLKTLEFYSLIKRLPEVNEEKKEGLIRRNLELW